MGALHDLRAGLRAAFEGLRQAVADAEIRRSYLWLLLLLLVLSSALAATGIWGIWRLTEALSDSGWLWSLFRIAARVLGVSAVVLAAPVLSLAVLNALAPVFNERPFFAGLRALDPGRAEALERAHGLSTPLAVGVGLRRLVRLVALQLLAIPIAMVPVVGPLIAPLFAAAASAYMVAWELLDPYYARLGLRFGSQADHAWTNRWALIGFGLPFAFAFAVPLVGPALFAAAQAAVARLVVDELERGTENPPRVSSDGNETPREAAQRGP